jgi:hypothetical protein
MSKQYSHSSIHSILSTSKFIFFFMYHNSIAFSIILCQIVQAQDIQVTQIIDELSLFPIHIQRIISLEYETIVLSLKSELVPVFTACDIDVFNIEFTQKLISLLSGFFSISFNKNLFFSIHNKLL